MKHCVGGDKDQTRPMPGLIQIALVIAVLLSAQTQAVTVTFAHQGDLHGKYMGSRTNSVPCLSGADCYGGLLYNTWYIDLMKMRFAPTFSIFSGDFFYGSFLDMQGGLPLATAMAVASGFDIIGIGDSDFKYGVDFLASFMRSVGSKFVCTNMDFSKLNTTFRKEMLALCPQYRILPVAQHRVAFLGYVTPQSVQVSKTGDIGFRDEIESLTAAAASLTALGVSIIVAVGHSGLEKDMEIARKVPSLDIIIGGHSHTWAYGNIYADNFGGALQYGIRPSGAEVMPYPIVMTQRSGRRVLVLHGSFSGLMVGAANVTFTDNYEVGTWYNPCKFMPHTTRNFYPQLLRYLKGPWNALAENMEKPVGTTLVHLASQDKLCQRSECNMGNMLADAYIWNIRTVTNVFSTPLPTIALINAGHIGQAIPIGSISMSNIRNMVNKFGFMHAVKLRGDALKEVLEHSVAEGFTDKFLQVAGAIVSYDMGRPPGQRLVYAQFLCNECVYLQDEALDARKIYTVVVTEWMAKGHHGYDIIRAKRLALIRYGIWNIQALYEYIKQKKNICPMNEGRITVTGSIYQLNDTDDKQKRTQPKNKLDNGRNRATLGSNSVTTLIVVITVRIIVFR